MQDCGGGTGRQGRKGPFNQGEKIPFFLLTRGRASYHARTLETNSYGTLKPRRWGTPARRSEVECGKRHWGVAQNSVLLRPLLRQKKSPAALATGDNVRNHYYVLDLGSLAWYCGITLTWVGARFLGKRKIFGAGPLQSFPFSPSADKRGHCAQD